MIVNPKGSSGNTEVFEETDQLFRVKQGIAEDRISVMVFYNYSREAFELDDRQLHAMDLFDMITELQDHWVSYVVHDHVNDVTRIFTAGELEAAVNNFKNGHEDLDLVLARQPREKILHKASWAAGYQWMNVKNLMQKAIKRRPAAPPPIVYQDPHKYVEARPRKKAAKKKAARPR